MIAAALALLMATGDVFQATLPDKEAKTPEMSTRELQEILASKSATVLDARPHLEYSMSHIPGALNVAAKPGVPNSAYVSDVAEVDRLVKGDKAAPLVLYCNGLYCGKSKRLAEELKLKGFTSVRRYQLGVPMWRALGLPTQIEAHGVALAARDDKTAVFIDVRPAGDFAKGTIAGAKSVPRSLVQVGKDVGELKKAKDDNRLPVNDHNTRIVVFGDSADDARFVAEQIGREAFHNVSFFAGTFRDLQQAVTQR